MRYSTIIATFIALAAAIPAITPVEENALAARTESVATTITLLPRQGFNNYDQTFDWPDSEVTGGGFSAQFQATNLGNGNYSFQFWNSSPANGATLNYRISYGGNTLISVDLGVGKTTTVTIPKTGTNFNVFIQLA